MLKTRLGCIIPWTLFAGSIFELSSSGFSLWFCILLSTANAYWGTVLLEMLFDAVRDALDE
jgi:hypothetical protein